MDVYANGDELLGDFKPGTLTDPQQLPAGDYDLAVFEAGADPDSADPAISADGVTVPADANITVVAHLGADGTPMLTPYVNDTVRAGRRAGAADGAAHRRGPGGGRPRRRRAGLHLADQPERGGR